jgi:hypothetical protein
LKRQDDKKSPRLIQVRDRFVDITVNTRHDKQAYRHENPFTASTGPSAGSTTGKPQQRDRTQQCCGQE